MRPPFSPPVMSSFYGSMKSTGFGDVTSHLPHGILGSPRKAELCFFMQHNNTCPRSLALWDLHTMRPPSTGNLWESDGIGDIPNLKRGSLSRLSPPGSGHQGSSRPGPSDLKSGRRGGLLLVPVRSLLAEPSWTIFPFLDHACHFTPVHLK